MVLSLKFKLVNAARQCNLDDVKVLLATDFIKQVCYRMRHSDVIA